MTNITLSVEDSVYRRMRRHSEVKWSEFVRKAVAKRLDELEKLEKRPDYETILTMLASEEVLRREWTNKADERWNDV